MSLNLSPYFVYARSQASGETLCVHMSSLLADEKKSCVLANIIYASALIEVH